MPVRSDHPGATAETALHQSGLPDFADPARFVDAAHDLPTSPRAGFAPNRKNIVGGGRMTTVWKCRRRGHPDHWNRALWALDLDRGMNVVVSMQHQLHAMLLQQRQHFR